MKRRNPAFIILIFLFWYYLVIKEREKPLLQDIFHKVRVTNLTQGGGLKAMEELAKLEAESVRALRFYIDYERILKIVGFLGNMETDRRER